MSEDFIKLDSLCIAPRTPTHKCRVHGPVGFTMVFVDAEGKQGSTLCGICYREWIEKNVTRCEEIKP